VIPRARLPGLRGAFAALVAAALLAAPPALGAGKALAPGERIDLNRASVTELMRLPGVGEKRAQAIVAARAKQPFRRAEDVVAVKGLGPAWFAKVKANVTVGGAPAAAGAPAATAKK
jgi:competence protein ComEA